MRIFPLIGFLIALATPLTLTADEIAAVQLNEKAPDFELVNQEGAKVKLSDYAGKNIILAFSRAHW